MRGKKYRRREPIQLETADPLYVKPGGYVRLLETGETLRVHSVSHTSLSVRRVGPWHFRWMRALARVHNVRYRLLRSPLREHVGEIWQDD